MKEEFFVGAEVSFAKIAPASGDMFGRFTIRLDEDAQAPFVLARKWRNINDRTFRLPLLTEDCEQDQS
jgi:Ni,Fe-hydrogenase III large subunit